MLAPYHQQCRKKERCTDVPERDGQRGYYAELLHRSNRRESYDAESHSRGERCTEYTLPGLPGGDEYCLPGLVAVVTYVGDETALFQ